MQKRFTFHGDSVLSLLRIIDPKDFLSPKRNSSGVLKLALHFPRLVKEEELDVLHDQWGDLLYAKEALRNLDKSATTFWTELKSVKDGNNELRFDCHNSCAAC